MTFQANTIAGTTDNCSLATATVVNSLDTVDAGPSCAGVALEIPTPEADLAVNGPPTTDAAADANAGTPFTVTINGSAINLGSDTTYGIANLSLITPPDCTPLPNTPKQSTILPLSQSQTQPLSASWQVTCANPSDHVFGGSVSVFSTSGLTDPNFANNGPVAASTDTTTVTAAADLSVVGLTVDAPNTATTGIAFNVSVSGDIHNAGPFSPAIANASLNLTVAADCTRSPGAQSDNGLSISTASDFPISKSWSVTCSGTGSHSFSGSATITLNQLHVSDPNAENNTATASDSSDLSPQPTPKADLAVNSTPTTDAPSGASAGSPFTVTINGSAINLGPDATFGEATLSLTIPPDCTASPDQPQQNTIPSLNMNGTHPLSASWQVTCSTPSNHNFGGAISVVATSGITDPNLANNGPVSAPTDTTTVTGTADLSVVGLTVDAPGSAITGTPFNITVSSGIHNAGPFSPANANATLNLTVPADCLRSPNSSQSDNGLSVSTATDTLVSKSWSVTCSATGSHSFIGNASVSLSELHVSDEQAENDTANSGDEAVLDDDQPAEADLAVSGTPTTNAPAGANAGTPFTVTINGSAINLGPDSTFGTGTMGLTVPPDCTASPDGPQQNIISPLNMSETQPLSASWEVTCSNPSDHSFGGAVSVVATSGITDPNLANNGPVASTGTTTVTSTANLSVVGLAVNAPNTATTGVAFNVSVSGDIHNAGSFSPANANATLDVTVPGDCTRSPNASQTDSGLSISTASDLPITKSWSVTCSGTGSHSFSGSATITLNQLHVSDPNAENNTATAGDSSDLSPQPTPKADLAVNGTPTTTAPSGASAGSPFTVTINGSAINLGPDATFGEATLSLTIPPDCTASPDQPQQNTIPSLNMNGTHPLSASWQVTCSTPSNHNFGGAISVVATSGITDPNLANNGPVSAPTDTTTVTGTADLSVVGLTVDAPGSAITGTPFNITVSSGIHNAGPFSPANANATLNLTVPADCLRSPNSSQSDNGLSVSTATDTLVSKSWSVTCSATGSHSFTGNASVSLSELHVSDNASEGNSASGNDNTTVSPAQQGTPVCYPFKGGKSVWYWKIYSGIWHLRDKTYDQLPIFLGVEPYSGPPEKWINDEDDAVYVFHDAFDGFNMVDWLKAQLLAAKLNALKYPGFEDAYLPHGQRVGDVIDDGAEILDQLAHGYDVEKGKIVITKLLLLAANSNGFAHLKILRTCTFPPQNPPRPHHDYDGDGYSDEVEGWHLGTDAMERCGEGNWPADLHREGPGANKLDVQDVLSFIGPVRHFGTNPGDPEYDARWDLDPAPSFDSAINILDLTSLIAGPTAYPEMFNGQRAFGRTCTP